MNKEIKDKLDLLRRGLSAKKLKKGKIWNGYVVYEPIYDKEYIGGLPHIVLVKDGEARISTHEECFSYIQYKKGGGINV